MNSPDAETVNPDPKWFRVTVEFLEVCADDKDEVLDILRALHESHTQIAIDGKIEVDDDE